MNLPRLRLAHLPTPLERHARLDELVGVELWVKRDDATGGVEAGNKIRKLEFLLGAAVAEGADAVVTCGGLQSNHARATAVLAARLGLSATLLLRVPDPRAAALPRVGNALLDRLVGADVRFVSPEEYRHRDGALEAVRQELVRAGRKPYVVPEGGSNGLGALGYVLALREVARHVALGLGPRVDAGAPAFDVVVHACGSGGTAAGVALGVADTGVARAVRAFAVCDDEPTFTRVVGRLVAEARGHVPELPPPAPTTIDDRARGPAYAVMDDAQKRFLVEVARTGGLVLDPVYTGKALFGLREAVRRGDVPRGARVLFVHTGGLPGLLAQGDELAEALGT